jgi:hypothetical protein
MTRYRYTSVTRIADLAEGSFDVRAIDRAEWSDGDYVVGEVLETTGSLHHIELSNGRMVDVAEGDLIVGAWGARAATLEAVGDWRAINEGQFDELTSAGLFGRTTSRSPFLGPLMSLGYRGHVLRGGAKVTMPGSVTPTTQTLEDVPVVLIVGTSMSSGKTLSGRLIVRLLKEAGLNVAGAKLTGAARYRDVLSYGDAGADAIYDFVDAGLPSTVCDSATYRRALDILLGKIAASNPDVIVAEAGASPLEPYNGDVAIEVLGERVAFMLLCASDPYAVLGVSSAFASSPRQPDLVAGGAANTTAGIELVKRLTGLTAMNLLNAGAREPLRAMLLAALNLDET